MSLLDKSDTILGGLNIPQITKEHDLLELGRRIAIDPTCQDFRIGDPPRPMTNVEMFAFVCYRRHERNVRIERDGCCGGRMSDSGRCPETGGMCPLFLAAQKIERKVFQPKIGSGEK